MLAQSVMNRAAQSVMPGASVTQDSPNSGSRPNTEAFSCPPDGVLAQYIEQTLSPEQYEELQRHLEGCDACDLMLTMLAGESRVGNALEASSGLDTSLDRFVRRTHLVAQFREGSSVGRFRILRQVGQGAMGIVYAAYDPQLDRNVALKVLLDDGTEDTGLSQSAQDPNGGRLLREARSMARLTHPNIVTLFEVGVAGGRVFLAMQLVEGSTLADWLRGGPPRDHVLALFVDVARALDAAHRAGVVHRDLKPHNILVSANGEAKVTDFGLADTSVASAVAEARDSARAFLTSTLHRTRGLVGTPAYMAPEVLIGERADALSDQFSFAVCLHEALTGKRPYDAASLDELVQVVEKGAPTVDASLDKAIATPLRRALAKEPAERFESMSALADALARSVQRGGEFVPPPSSRTARHRSRAWPIGATLVAISTIVTVGLVMRTRPAPVSSPTPSPPPPASSVVTTVSPVPSGSVLDAPEVSAKPIAPQEAPKPARMVPPPSRRAPKVAEPVTTPPTPSASASAVPTTAPSPAPTSDWLRSRR